MALSQSELQQCRFWLGYTNLLASARPYLDIATVFEDVVQSNLDPAWGEGYVRNTILPNLTATETALQTQVLLQAQAVELVGDVKLDVALAQRTLQNQIEYWKDQLSATLGVPRADRKGSSNLVVT